MNLAWGTTSSTSHEWCKRVRRSVDVHAGERNDRSKNTTNTGNGTGVRPSTTLFGGTLLQHGRVARCRCAIGALYDCNLIPLHHETHPSQSKRWTNRARNHSEARSLSFLEVWNIFPCTGLDCPTNPIGASKTVERGYGEIPTSEEIRRTKGHKTEKNSGRREVYTPTQDTRNIHTNIESRERDPQAHNVRTDGRTDMSGL